MLIECTVSDEVMSKWDGVNTNLFDLVRGVGSAYVK